MKLKDEETEILAVQSVINENGYAVETLEPICPSVWAYFRHLSGREYHAANAEQMQEEVLFTINWRNDVTSVYISRPPFVPLLRLSAKKLEIDHNSFFDLRTNRR